MLYGTVVNSQKCEGVTTVGSLDYNEDIVPPDKTFILIDNIIPCSGTVTAWEFCYQVSDATSVTFYPSIWGILDKKKNTNFVQIKSNNVTFKPNGNGDYSCQTFNLSLSEQFKVSEGLVVGVYFNKGRSQPKLLFIHANDSMRAFSINGNQSNIKDVENNREVHRNIAIKVHIGKLKYYCF